MLAFSLSMDALAVALATGFGLGNVKTRHPIRLGVCFGLAQSLTVALGWVFGNSLRRHLAGGAAWLAFALLMLIGGKMVYEALRTRDDEEPPKDPSRGWSLLMLSAATSVDGVAVGVPLAALGVPIGRCCVLLPMRRAEAARPV